MDEDHDLYVEDPYAEEDYETWRQHPGVTPEVRSQTVQTSNRRSALQQYGLTEADYGRLLQKQSGVCAICKGTNKSGQRLSVDHCHETGRVRGLLCSNCNRGMGLLKDDPDILRLAVRYLEEPQGD